MKRLSVFWGFLILLVAFISTTLYAQTNKSYSMNDCIKIALKNNTDIVSAKSNFTIAKSGLKSARGNFLPTINTSAGWTRTEEQKFYVQGQVFTYPNDSYEYRFSLSQPIFSGFSKYYTLKKNLSDTHSAENNLEWTKQQIVLNVKYQYYTVLKAIQLLKVAEETLNASEEELIRIETMERIGSVSKAEVYQQKVRVGENKLSLIQAKNDLSNAKANLNHVLGIDINSEYELEEESLEIPEIELDFDKFIQEALKNRIDYQATKEEVNSKKATVNIRRSAYYPTISLGANYSWNNVEFPNSVNDLKKYDTYSMSLNLQMNLFNGFQTKASVEQAKAQVVSSKANMEQAKRQVMLDVKKAVLDLQQAAENVEVTNENLFSSEEDYRLAKERYKIGAGTLLEQLTAETNLTRAKANRIQALYNYKYAQAALDLALGNLKTNN
jgi:outer membrane protein